MNKYIVTVVAAFASMLAGSTVLAQATSSLPADNSKSNKTDATNTYATADAQSNSPADIDLTKRIRLSLMADKSLSTYAHNVKIVTVNGNVILNGVVRSEDERSAIETQAASIAGKNKVTDEIKVAPK